MTDKCKTKGGMMGNNVITHDFGRRDPAPGDPKNELPAVFKNPSHHTGLCRHDAGPFTLLEAEEMAECKCGARITLVHVFKLLCQEENKMRQRFEYQRALLQKNEDRLKTKCDHCGKFSFIK